MLDSRRCHWVRRWAIPIALFAIAFVPRALHPVSWPMQWYTRAIGFWDGILARDWTQTFQRYHPGVTTMWLCGAGLRLFAWGQGLSSEEIIGIAPTKPGVIDSAVSAGVLPAAIFISSTIVASYLILRRLVGGRTAAVAALLIALDPLYLTHSKMVHVNGLLTACMFLSALFLLEYVRSPRPGPMVCSGLFAGLSWLTKSPSLFLIPYMLLVLGFRKLTTSRSDTGLPVGANRLLKTLPAAVLIWGAGAVLVFVALWPAMWVAPLDTLRRLSNSLAFHVQTTHYNPVFFNQESTFEDPGILFYLATVGWKTTLVTLPMFLVQVLFTLRRCGRSKFRWVTWSLLAYAVFFTVQMSLGGWKQIAYLLPIFPALDVIAALGVVQIAERIEHCCRPRSRSIASTAFVCLVLVLQAGVVLPRHPYYGTHHNVLLGGSRTAQRVLPLQNQNEGLELAASYINGLPRAQRAIAGLHQRGAATFRYKFVGLTTTIDDPRVDYRVYFLNHLMRQLDADEWESQWEADRETSPLYTVSFDNVIYVWVFGAPPPEPAANGREYHLNYQLGEHICLERVRISSEQLAPGDTLTVVPVWTSDGEIGESYKVFCHVLSCDGELVAQQDGLPLNGIRPTQTWRKGEAIEDSYEIAIGADARADTYKLSVGMYDPTTMTRLPACDAAGERISQDRLVVATLRIAEPEDNGE